METLPYLLDQFHLNPLSNACFCFMIILLQGSQSNFWNYFPVFHIPSSKWQSWFSAQYLQICFQQMFIFSTKFYCTAASPGILGFQQTYGAIWSGKSSVVKRVSPGLCEEKLPCNLSVRGPILLFSYLVRMFGLDVVYVC